MSLSKLPYLIFTLMLTSCAFLGTFRGLDVNGDGGIDRDEANANGYLRDIFSSADDDKNGVLDEEEYEAARTVLERYRREDAAVRRSGGSGTTNNH